MATRDKSIWILIVFILSGLVIGGLLGELAARVDFLWWLSYGQSFGLTDPLSLDLNIIKITFGLQLKINIASIIGMGIAIFIYRKVELIKYGGRKEGNIMSVTMKQLPESERPYEKLEMYGANSLSNSELLAIIIKTGTKEYTSVELAKQILALNDSQDIRDLRFLRRNFDWRIY